MNTQAAWLDLLPGGIIAEPGNSAAEHTGSWRERMPRLSLDRCTHCLICWIFCPDDSIVVRGSRMEAIDLDHCKGCGICALECPAGAIVMEEASPLAFLKPLTGHNVDDQEEDL